MYGHMLLNDRVHHPYASVQDFIIKHSFDTKIGLRATALSFEMSVCGNHTVETYSNCGLTSVERAANYSPAVTLYTCTLGYGVLLYEPHSEKTGLRGFRPGPTQIGLYSHRRYLEA